MIGVQLREQRRRLLLTQKQLAREAGISRSALCAVEGGFGTLASLYCLLEALQCRLVTNQSSSKLGQRLATARKKRKWSRAEVAKRLGTSAPTITNIERDRGRVHTADRYCDLVGLCPRVRPKRPRSYFDCTGSDEWNTPKELADLLYRVLGEFDLDPASNPRSHIRAKRSFSESDNGLAQEWRGRVWCNPPYSNISPWCERMLAAHKGGAVKLGLVLLPARTSARYFHRFVFGHATLLWLPRRLKFNGRRNQSPIINVIAAWGGSPSEIGKLAASLNAHVSK